MSDQSLIDWIRERITHMLRSNLYHIWYPSKHPSNHKLVLLATEYSNTTDIDFIEGIYILNPLDFKSKLWFTYRTNFSPIKTYFTSDVGWGCSFSLY
jgi:hypothetical protein